MERPGMMIYFNTWGRLKKRLSYAQLGRLLSATLDKAEGHAAESLDDDPMVAMAADMVEDSLDRDAVRYNEIVERRREAGRKGGIRRQQNARQVQANAEQAQANVKQTQANSSNVKQTEQIKPTTTPTSTPTSTPITTPTPTPISSPTSTPVPTSTPAPISSPTPTSTPAPISTTNSISLSETRAEVVDEGLERETASDAVHEESDWGFERETSHDAVHGEYDGWSKETYVWPDEPPCEEPAPYDAEREIGSAFCDETGGEKATPQSEDALTRRTTASWGREASPQRTNASWNEASPQRTNAFQSSDVSPQRTPASQCRNMPTLNDVVEYAASAGLSIDGYRAQKFIDEQSANNWCDSHGVPIRDWHRWLAGWIERHPAQRPKDTLPSSMQYSQRRYTDEELARIVMMDDDE